MLPGGFGTLDELFEVLRLVQTQKVTFPVVLVDSSYWSGLVEWLRSVVAERGSIAASDLEILTITDDIDEAVTLLQATRPTLTQARHPE